MVIWALTGCEVGMALGGHSPLPDRFSTWLNRNPTNAGFQLLASASETLGPPSSCS